ncbi:hypothetical protein CLV92_1221 [Kineococcus xinjiangensis]|uniref:Uncharacterized protein n=1 Tax=Kineococcus xinjiangensis TaxID=512762 RepID=A0A2S6IC69_9ACTN|nr:hypothetical protein [Kineococcus xinjiangensis]PPK90826.1 hypothetical protein CLV92_1221 [Kineococcus xinjiangensis]
MALGWGFILQVAIFYLGVPIALTVFLVRLFRPAKRAPLTEHLDAQHQTKPDSTHG